MHYSNQGVQISNQFNKMDIRETNQFKEQKLKEL